MSAMSNVENEKESLEGLIARLADEFEERLERGESPTVDEYALRWPEHALVIRQVLASLQLIRPPSPLSPPSGDEIVDGAAAVDGQPMARALGDFELVREVGRGGMGVVYEARQLSLDRRVALKVLPFAGMLDPRHLQRFKNEAQAAAQLDHPNIVGVIAVGCERGVHYYAMRFIDGPTLAEVIAALRDSREPQASGGRKPPVDLASGGQAAGASGQDGGQAECSRQLAVGSHQGAGDNGDPLGPTLTRSASKENDAESSDCLLPSAFSSPPAPDCPLPTASCRLSPSTSPIAALSTGRAGRGREYFRSVAALAIQAAEALDHAHELGVVHRDVKPSNLILDPQGKLWVADFGLARIESRSEVTRTGDLLGTLRYMSPEQALGKRVPVDHRTDVFSLGVTLYELLTLEPAFDGEERQEVLRQVSFDDPRAPRRVDARVPVELETIVLNPGGSSPVTLREM